MVTKRPSPKGGTTPNFWPCLLSPNGCMPWMDQDATWYDGRPRPRQHCVRCGPTSTPKGHNSQILAHVCGGQTARCIRLPLGTEVGLGPGNIVLDGGPAPPSQKRDTAPNFRPISIVAKRSPISATAELALVLRVIQCLTLQ